MKILQLISSLGYFGAENVLVLLAAELAKDVSNEVVSGVIENLATPHLEVAAESEKRGIETACFSCRGKLDIRTIMKLRRYIKQEGIDIIHSHGYKSNLFAFFAASGLPVGLVATCHNWLGDDPKMKFYAVLDKFFLRKFSQVVAVSSEVQQQLIRSRIAHSQVSLIKNGVDIDRFAVSESRDKLRSALGISPDQLVIGTVGRISAEKGHRHLLNLANTIEKKYPEISFLIVGDGDLRKELQTDFDKPNIIFTGLRSDLPELYSCMDIFVLPSLTEGLPMVLLEAMASRLPVVATRVGYVPQVVKDNETGFLVAPGDEDALREKLLYLIGKPEERQLMGQKGRTIVEKSFSSVQMAGDYLKVYQKAMRLKGCHDY